jgi:hypothetical protein
VNARPLAPALVTLALGAGCGSTGPSDAVARCPRTAETDNFGCAVVAGTVRAVPLYLRATNPIDPPASDSVLVRAVLVPADSVPDVVEADLFFQVGP